MKKILVTLFFIFVFLPLITWGLTSSVNNTFEYNLKNGLHLIVRVDQRAPVVLSSVWYRVGGSYEHDGITGISHMLEHMMFKGTKQYGPGQLIKIISQNGGQQNAMTSDDYTMYYQLLGADKLPISFRLEADRMRHLLLKAKAFAEEKKVVMEERRMRIDDNPQALTWERFRAAAFVNNPYHHPVAGWMADIKSLSLNNLTNWYQKWYAPNNATVIVVGKVKPGEVLALAKKYFGVLKPSKIISPKPRTSVKPLGKKVVYVSAPAKLPWLVMGYNVPTLATANEKWQAYALLVAAAVLDSGNSSRFARQLIREQQVAVGASAEYDLYDLHNSLFVLSGTPAVNHSVNDLESAFLVQIHKLQTGLVNKKELQRIKAQVIAQNVYGKDSLMAQAMDLGMPVMVGLPWQTSDEFVNRVTKVTAAQVQEVAKKYFIPTRLTVAILQPTK